MESTLLRAFLALIIPIIVFGCGAWGMKKISNRAYVIEQLEANTSPGSKDKDPLNQRLGYDKGAVERHWGALDQKGLKCERRFLELDLIFPFLYGAALIFGMLIAWNGLGRPFHATWLIAPVAITMIADWVENTVQLVQIFKVMESGVTAIEANWISIASGATIIKLVFFAGSFIFLLGLIVVMLIHAYRVA